VGYAASTELSRIVSAVKFVKPVTFVLLGSYLAMIFPPLLLLRRMATVFALVVLATMGTAVMTPAFPRCGWGRFLFAWETYGYPNAPMTFYGIMVPLLVAAVDVQQRRAFRVLFRVATGIAILLVVASLSRSSTIAMTVGLSCYLFSTSRGHIPVATVIVGVVFAVAGVGLMKLETDIDAINFLQSAVDRRLTQTIDSDDPFAGRVGIWMHALELCSEKPVLGYAFEPFSRYSNHFDTPHQQYLEVLYKTGLVGGLLYFTMLGSGLVGLWHLVGRTEPRSAQSYLMKALLAAYVGTLLGNFSQPNFSYSLTGNTLFLMVGAVLTRHGAAGLVTTGHASGPTTIHAFPAEESSPSIPDSRAA
jgi:O-antigen ligase